MVPLFIVSGLIGCASFTSFQDAHTCERGTMRVDGGFALFTETSEEDTGVGIVIQTGFRRGITDNLDIGFSLMANSVVIDAKYFFNSRIDMFGISSGLKMGFMTLAVWNDSISSRSTFDVILPVYTSFYPVPFVALSVNPDVLWRFPIDDESGGDSPVVFIGGNTNIRFGNECGGYFEMGLHKQLGEERTIISYGFAYYWPLSFDWLLNLFGG